MADDAARRIDYLIKNELTEMHRSDDGLCVLYFDENNNRYWELTYPSSDERGAGAPCLDAIPNDLATDKINSR